MAAITKNEKTLRSFSSAASVFVFPVELSIKNMQDVKLKNDDTTEFEGMSSWKHRSDYQIVQQEINPIHAEFSIMSTTERLLLKSSLLLTAFFVINKAHWDVNVTPVVLLFPHLSKILLIFLKS